MNKVKVNCMICNKEQEVFPCRAKQYKTCSKECRGKYSSNLYDKNAENTCLNCGKGFNLKPSHKERRTYCSKICQATHYSTRYRGIKNPNYKNALTDSDGYKIVECKTKGCVKEHIHVATTILNVDKIPKGYHVHHRDCDILNNNPDNLAILSISDHKWLHKNFGNTVLWAHYYGKISTATLSEWSRETDRAEKLLETKLINQIGVFKSSELLESPEEDNQQPS